jgi:aspartate aminotransferase
MTRSPLKLSRRALAIELSPTQVSSQRARVLRAAGRQVLDFTVGEPDQDTPAHIVAAGKAALDAGQTRYSPSAGLAELRGAVVEAYRRDFGVRFERDEAVITSGGKHALYIACQALLNAGDEVLVPTPAWPTFGEAVRLAGGRAVVLPLREAQGFQLTARTLSRAVTARTRAVIVNSPSNPTGVCVAPQELLAIAQLARKRGFTLLFDDTYAWLTLEPQRSVLQELRELLGEHFAILGSASKTHCMTGWRIGWLLGSRALAEAATSLISHSTQCPATFAQVAAVQALAGPQKHVQALVAEYGRRRDIVYKAVCKIPRVSCVHPDGGFYVFPNVTPLLSRRVPTTLALAERLLEETGVAVVPGEGFGAPGFLRFSFARPIGEVEAGIRRLGVFLSAL